jgi:hypothetical protein
MATRGTKPKPLELKRKLGNPGKRAIPVEGTLVPLPPANGVPAPLRPLKRDGAALWKRVWTNAQGWLSPGTDIEAVQLLAEAMDERQVLRAMVMRDGDWRDRIQLRHLEHQLMQQLATIGFDPTARARLGVAEIRRVSAIEELAARRGVRA